MSNLISQRHVNRFKSSSRKAKGGIDATWTAAQGVVSTLTVEGHSGDETESEDVFGHRVVRRLRRPWLNQEISSLMCAIDTYFMEPKDQAGVRKRGNLGLTRHTTAKNDDDRPYMVGLPANFYDSEWLKRLDEYEKAELNVRPPMNIPTIVSLFDGLFDNISLIHVRHLMFERGRLNAPCHYFSFWGTSALRLDVDYLPVLIPCLSVC